MSAGIKVIIHPSQFPEAVQAELERSLRERAINHKFHYESYKQTQKWLALHEAYSPARTDPDCGAVYDSAFATVAAAFVGRSVHLIGLGAGGGQKDSRFLQFLSGKAAALRYTPVDVSTPMALVATLAAQAVVRDSMPLVCDLQLATDLNRWIDEEHLEGASRLLTFFGMIPNFQPDLILPRLAEIILRDDLLLFSANLAPGLDYRGGVERVAPLYDNELTREWLMTLLLDLGVERSHGELKWSIEGDTFLRLEAGFHFRRTCTIRVGRTEFRFEAGERVRLFFSYRYTPQLIAELLRRYGLAVEQQWITKSGEEGVFLCRRGEDSV